MEDGNGRKTKTYCVTGATGYIGSWLVKSLLRKGYKVHATLRNPEKANHLLESCHGGDQLRLFVSDLQKDGSFDEAVIGCDGVFHVAASMEFEVPLTENVDYVQSEIIDPAVRGTMNVLKACLKSSTVKKVVFTSSISTLTAKDSFGKWKSVVDESCQTHVDQVLKTKASGWAYVLSKLSAEEAALQFAKENGIDLVSILTTTVGGPFLTALVPASIQVLVSPITGDVKLFSILAAVNSRMGSIALVHIDDICSAHIFLMENSKSEGRYICCTRSCVMSELVELLSKEHSSTAKRISFSDRSSIAGDKHDAVPIEISSKKIREMGFNFKCSIGDIIHQTVRKCVDCGFLQPDHILEKKEISENL